MNNVFSQSVDNGLTFEVSALHFIAVIIFCGKEFRIYHHTGVQALAVYFKRGFKSQLLHI